MKKLRTVLFRQHYAVGWALVEWQAEGALPTGLANEAT
jgi:hypothetical protein